ncbi:C cytochrome precursor [Stieleria sp. JC731]|uniref:multiheme c-type cytochrome n=1 Tax=Pirellulaceae TaxID=2691357 RepID=UPI001E52E07F|nr:multiheme c-type cytochrome [Stieleria sp. JC731]MCC9602612.1 C cytochrome precursor [Stieleria sp. JC731]
MLKSPLTISIAVIVVACLAYAIYSATSQNDDVDLDALMRRESQRQSRQELASLDESLSAEEIAQLAIEGRGQKLPKTLVAWPMSDSNSWFVGREKYKVGVEIPFEPGHLPNPAPNLEPEHANPGFLGAEACRSCHESIYDSFVETAHFRTSRSATPDNIAGSFSDDANKLKTHSPDVSFEMFRREDKSFQRVHFFDWMFEVPIDITVGSNLLGESYLYWHGDKLYQLHASYLTAPNEWANSPGFVDGDASFARDIHTACLECHATYVDARQDDSHFTPSTLILGVSCERCHGPGKSHVLFHQENPESNEAHAITVPSDLSRQQQMQVCGQCHTGVKQLKDPHGFQFRPGDQLDDHYVANSSGASANGVHTSNQLERLSESRCFQETTMACVDCHNPHRNDRGQLELFSQKCLKCHESSHCGMAEEVGDSITSNCIDCHMPRRATKNMSIETASGDVFPPLRDHHIRIDLQSSHSFLRSLKSQASE